MTDIEAEVFEYLNVVRDTGTINMFGAVPYLMVEFGFTTQEAQEWLLKWMKSFNDEDEDDEN